MARKQGWAARIIAGLAAWTLCLPLSATSATALDRTVTYSTADGATLITGTLIRKNGLFARVETEAGPITLAVGDLLCAGPGCAVRDPDLHIAGAPEMARILLPALIQRYATALNADLDQSTSADGDLRFQLSRAENMVEIVLTPMPEMEAFAAQQLGKVDLVMSLRPPADTTPRRIHILALDGLVPAVARENPLTALTLPQIRGVLSGQITDWAALGHPKGGPIDLLHSPSLAARDPSLLPDLTAPKARALDPDRPIGAQVATTPGAFAILRASRLGRAKAMDVAGGCGRPIPAAPAYLKAEDYPLAAPLTLILPAGRLTDSAFGFLSFLNSPAAQLVVRRAGYADQLPDRVSLRQQGQRLSNAIAAAGQPGAASLADLQAFLRSMDGAERLTLTFRFEDGGSALDAQSMGNLTRLAQMIDSGRISGETIVLAGFGDGTGPAEANQALSLERAEAVRDALAQALRGLRPEAEPIALEVQAHGEALPIGCDDTEWGRQMNRRVEVWLRPAPLNP